MSWRPHGRARISARNPQATGICDRCGFFSTLSDLRWQYQFAGNNLINLRLLVCRRCYDEPQPQLRTLVLPPDPQPVLNPRPEYYAQEVPSFISTEDLNTITTEGGDPLIQEIEDTPSPDPNNPVLPPTDS